MASMRAVGYSLPTAIADVIDNSIAARARAVNVLFNGSAKNPYVAVLDNGTGMDGRGARTAMRLAGTNATEQREAADLGRFGLGLKTASLSQCRRLTLITKHNGEVTGLSWDLDLIESTGGWLLQVHEQDELTDMPHYAELTAQHSGTLVVWTKLDRLIDGEVDKGRFLDAQMAIVRDHLSLVFHRFIGGDGVAKVKIQMNYVDVGATDPFLSGSKRTQTGQLETVTIAGSSVAIRPYTLPYLNKMTKKERASATANGTLRDAQGFYVYRAGRLVVWGTWFRLTPKNEMGRLTRVRVDIPNTLDHLWSLDIKKSAAVPPSAVRSRLKELAARFVEPSERIHRYRGRASGRADPITRTWSVIEERDSARYEINREHPALQKLADALSTGEQALLERALEIIETTFPAQDLFNRMSNDTPIAVADAPPESLMQALLELWALDARNTNAKRFVDVMTLSEPFNVLLEYREELVNKMTAITAKGTSA